MSKQSQHTHLRVRRDDGTGWDHARCRPLSRTAADEIDQRRELTDAADALVVLRSTAVDLDTHYPQEKP